MKTLLEARVEAQNRANAEVNRLTPIFIQNFTPLVGKKVMKIGGLVEKYRNLIPETKEFQIYRYSSECTLMFMVKVCVNYGNYTCTYCEMPIHIGTLKDMFLTTVFDNFKPLPTDYTVDGVIALRKVLSNAKKAVSIAERNLLPFDEYDRN